MHTQWVRTCGRANFRKTSRANKKKLASRRVFRWIHPRGNLWNFRDYVRHRRCNRKLPVGWAFRCSEVKTNATRKNCNKRGRKKQREKREEKEGREKEEEDGKGEFQEGEMDAWPSGKRVLVIHFYQNLEKKNSENQMKLWSRRIRWKTVWFY